MGRALGLRGDFTTADLKRLARSSRDAGQTRRLLALAVIYDGGSWAEAAETGGVGRQIVRDWVERFNAEGPDGLVSRKPPGNPSTLNDAQRTELVRIVERGPVRGAIEIVSDAEADAYFATRGRDSRLGAWASDQSRPLADRAQFMDRFEHEKARLAFTEMVDSGRTSGRERAANYFLGKLELRSEHRLNWSLSGEDQRRIERAGVDLIFFFSY